ncbi:VOC family protein [Ramlibacter cellulosilyticus]|uniref:VOC family protein n=1 Tax=Ramlibacter cellulosilyticus TaxID=2764187 RepID=UPI002105D783|nr:VOC family protein [Ramlibacter cellulosilyticus]
MAMQIDCYLSFHGNCEEALNFYAQCLGGKVTTLMRFEGSPMDGKELSPEWKKKVMHGTVEAEGAQIMGSDVPPGMGSVSGYNGITVSLWVKGGVDQARKAFDALAAGGQVKMPFAPPFWGGHFGMLTDKFGVPWMVSCE